MVRRLQSSSLIITQEMNVSTILLTLLPYVIKHNEDAQENLIDTAAYVSSKVFEADRTVSVLWWEDVDEYVDIFLKKYTGNYVVSAFIHEWKDKFGHNGQLYQRFVCFVRKSDDFKAAVFIINNNIVTPLKLVLVITENVKEKELKEFTKVAWENDIGDIIIVTKESDESKVSLMTYFPYFEGTCGNHKPVKLNSLEDNLFPRKFANFYGCPLRITLLDFIPYVSLKLNNGGIVTGIGGIDGGIYTLVAEKLNATSQVLRTDNRGGIGNVRNGTGTGSFGDLIRGDADICIPAPVLNINRYAATQISHAYKTLDVFWYAPIQREIYTWAKILLPFINNATAAICLAFIFFVIITKFIQKYHTNLHERKSILFLAYGVFMGQEMKFEINSRFFNIVFILWIWFCQIVRIKYQDELLAGFQKKILEPRYETLVQAIQGVDEFGGVEIFREFYRNTTYKKVYKVISMIDVQQYIREISDGKIRFLLASDVILVRLLRKQLQKLSEPISLAHTCIHMRPRWPAAPEVDRTIQNIISSGYLDKIVDDYIFQWSLLENITSTDDVATAINMTMISACFIGLIALWLVCCFVFLMEVVYYRKSHKK